MRRYWNDFFIIALPPCFHESHPTEVVPEFTADVGTKKGEKVDYAIMKDGKPILLFECKVCGTDLETVHRDQLYRYFSVTEARIGVLTDGVIYRFYSDLEEPNKMDEHPFLEVNLLNLRQVPLSELKKLTKSSFDLDAMLPAARELKYTREIKRILSAEMTTPSQDLVKMVTKQVYSGNVTQGVVQQFTDIVRKAFRDIVNEQINERLQSAISQASSPPEPTSQPSGDGSGDESEEDTKDSKQIVTTAEELEGYHIVRAILAQSTDPSRITYKDTRRYFNILLDGNSWRQLCRLYLDGRTKKIGLFDKGKEEYKVEIDSVSDIYQYSDQIKATLERLDQTEK